MRWDKKFTAILQKSLAKSGHTYDIWPESVSFFKTRGLVKARGTLDYYPFQSSFMALGDGRHKLAVKVAIRQAIGNDAGDEISVHLQEELN